MERFDNNNNNSDEEDNEEGKAEDNQTYKETFSLNSSVVRNSFTEKQK